MSNIDLKLVQTKDLMIELMNRGSSAIAAVLHTVDSQDDEEMFMFGGSNVTCLGLAAGAKTRLEAIVASQFLDTPPDEVQD